MFEWISFKDKQPNLGDLIIAWEGEYYSVGKWTKHTCSDGVVIGPYIDDTVGACCCTKYKSDVIRLWAAIPDPEKDKNV